MAAQPAKTGTYWPLINIKWDLFSCPKLQPVDFVAEILPGLHNTLILLDLVSTAYQITCIRDLWMHPYVIQRRNSTIFYQQRASSKCKYVVRCVTSTVLSSIVPKRGSEAVSGKPVFMDNQVELACLFRQGSYAFNSCMTSRNSTGTVPPQVMLDNLCWMFS